MSVTPVLLCLAAVCVVVALGWLDVRGGAWIAARAARFRPPQDRSFAALALGLAVLYVPAIWLSPRISVSRLVGIVGFLIALLLLLTRRRQALQHDPLRVTLVGGLFALCVVLPLALLLIWVNQALSG